MAVACPSCLCAHTHDQHSGSLRTDPPQKRGDTSNTTRCGPSYTPLICTTRPSAKHLQGGERKRLNAAAGRLQGHSPDSATLMVM